MGGQVAPGGRGGDARHTASWSAGPGGAQGFGFPPQRIGAGVIVGGVGGQGGLELHHAAAQHSQAAAGGRLGGQALGHTAAQGLAIAGAVWQFQHQHGAQSIGQPGRDVLHPEPVAGNKQVDAAGRTLPRQAQQSVIVGAGRPLAESGYVLHHQQHGGATANVVGGHVLGVITALQAGLALGQQAVQQREEPPDAGQIRGVQHRAHLGAGREGHCAAGCAIQRVNIEGFWRVPPREGVEQCLDKSAFAAARCAHQRVVAARRKVDDQRQLTLVFGVVDAAHSGGKLPPRRLFWPLRGGRQHQPGGQRRQPERRQRGQVQTLSLGAQIVHRGGKLGGRAGSGGCLCGGLHRAACRVNALGQRSGLRGGRTAPPGLEQGKHLVAAHLQIPAPGPG